MSKKCITKEKKGIDLPYFLHHEHSGGRRKAPGHQGGESKLGSAERHPAQYSRDLDLQTGLPTSLLAGGKIQLIKL